MADSGLAEPGTRREAALRYRVGGMDCPSCAGKIEAAIGRLGGACDIRVNFQTQVLVFRLDEAATPREVVEERIRQLGYHVEAVVGPRIDPAQDAKLEPGRGASGLEKVGAGPQGPVGTRPRGSASGGLRGSWYWRLSSRHGLTCLRP